MQFLWYIIIKLFKLSMQTNLFFKIHIVSGLCKMSLIMHYIIIIRIVIDFSTMFQNLVVDLHCSSFRNFSFNCNMYTLECNEF